jgi:hypothetical protein
VRPASPCRPACRSSLTEAQLKLRAHQVAELKGSDGFFVAERDRLQFKRGEVVELATELPKAMIAGGIIDRSTARTKALPLPLPVADAGAAPRGASRGAK